MYFISNNCKELNETTRIWFDWWSTGFVYSFFLKILFILLSMCGYGVTGTLLLATA